MKNLPDNTDILQSLNINQGPLLQIYPPLYDLSLCIEENPWHNHQSVFDHTIAALAFYETAVKAWGEDASKSKKRLIEYVQAHVYGSSRDTLTRLAIIFHDIAKPQTWQRDPETHRTACPAHALAGSIIVERDMKHFGLSTGAIKTVSQLVLLHPEAHEVFNQVMREENDEAFKAFQKTVGDLYMPLIILAEADMEGSDLSTCNPIVFAKRQALYLKEVARFSASL